MAENKNAKKAAAAAEAAPAPASESVSSTPSQEARKEKKKSRWTLDTCHRAAKRYTTRADWAKNAPSSYKAAASKGWADQCCAHMTAPVAKAKPRARKSA